MPEFDWPSWTADCQKAYSEVRAHDPLCTIVARAAEPACARALLEARTNWILDQLEQVQNNITMRKETAH